MPDKTATKTPKLKLARPSPRSGVRLPLGNHPGNTGGKKGRSGPKPREFKDFVKAEIRDDPDRRAALVRAAGDDKGRNFKAAWDLAADYDDEKPAEKHTIVGPVVVQVQIVREGKKITAG